MTKNIKIGVFDSGIGGFSILNEIFKILPEVDIYYIADEAFAPYGTKKLEAIIERSKSNTKELLNFNPDLILVACNTATAVAINTLRDEFLIPFVGVEPYINIINKKNEDLQFASFAVITTLLTGKSDRFRRLKEQLDPDNEVTHYSLPNLASLIEEAYHQGGVNQSIRLKIKKELDHYVSGNHTHLILGCTHYPLVAEEIEQLLSVKTISPCANVALRVKNLLYPVHHEGFDIKKTDLIQNKTFNFLNTKIGEWTFLDRSSVNIRSLKI